MGKTTHGGAHTPEYLIWRNIRDRCLNPNTKLFAFYGARGITVCQRWQDSFAAFIEDIGWRPDPSLTVDRIDNDKGYEPNNRRQREDTVLINGERLQEAAKRVGIPYQTVYARLQRGWSPAVALLKVSAGG